jgi:hypothetical protein
MRNTYISRWFWCCSLLCSWLRSVCLGLWGSLLWGSLLCSCSLGLGGSLLGRGLLCGGGLGLSFLLVRVSKVWYVVARCGTLWHRYANLWCSSFGCSGRLSLLLRKLHWSRCAYSAMRQQSFSIPYFGTRCDGVATGDVCIGDSDIPLG